MSPEISSAVVEIEYVEPQALRRIRTILIYPSYHRAFLAWLSVKMNDLRAEKASVIAKGFKNRPDRPVARRKGDSRTIARKDADHILHSCIHSPVRITHLEYEQRAFSLAFTTVSVCCRGICDQSVHSRRKIPEINFSDRPRCRHTTCDDPACREDFIADGTFGCPAVIAHERQHDMRCLIRQDDTWRILVRSFRPRHDALRRIFKFHTQHQTTRHRFVVRKLQGLPRCIRDSYLCFVSCIMGIQTAVSDKGQLENAV